MRVMPKLRGLDLGENSEVFNRLLTQLSTIKDESLIDAFKKAQKLEKEKEGKVWFDRSIKGDKWNPGDIWMTTMLPSEDPFKQIKRDWQILNRDVLIQAGKVKQSRTFLLGISLKKTGSPRITEFNLPAGSYTAFDAVSLRELIVNRLSEKGVFTDQIFVGSNLSSLIDVMAYSYHVLMFYLNRTSSETMFTEAQIYENINLWFAWFRQNLAC